MTVNYTTNLALGLPVTGTESGTWGDDVNNAITAYLDISIAGGLAVTVTVADVTLTNTQGTNSATNIGSTTAQYAILNVSGAMTAARNLILPSSSRQYVINNACTGGFLLTVKGSATSGVTMVNGEKAHVFWNGSDYAKAANTAGVATFTSITNTGLTSGRVVYSTTGGLETDSAGLTFDGTNFATTGTATAAKLIPTGSSVTGNGMYLPAANALGFSTAGVNAVYIDSTQNVGIGVTPSAWGSAAKVLQIGAFSAFYQDIAGYPEMSFNSYETTNNVYKYQVSANTASLYSQRGAAHQWYIAPSGTAGNTISYTQAMTLDSSGNLLVGTTTATLNNVGCRIVSGTSNSDRIELGSAASTNSTIGYSMYSTGAAAYRFYVGWGGTIFATSATITAISDQRFKENIRDLDDGLTSVMALKPRKFDWKEGKGADIKNARGFIAQEFEQVFPDMVDTWQDPAPDGEEPYKAVRADLIPTLVKAIQEQQALITSLTARIEALEAR